MIELGYMAKRIALRPEWLDVPAVHDIYAVSDCVSDDFCDYMNWWKHNGFWFFDSPGVILDLSNKHNVDLSATVLLYYRGYEQQYDEDVDAWTDYAPSGDVLTNVVPPTASSLLGYDIVSYSMQSSPECSPLSCNQVAADVPVNKHCLMDSLDDAIACLQDGACNDGEPGPFRIVAVNEVAWPSRG